MKTIPYEKFKHGQRVTCEIMGVKIDDAKISIDSDGTAYICQNIQNGIAAEDKLGYRMGWTINRREYYKDGDNNITNLQFLPRTLDDIEEGDVVVDSDGVEKTIVGICGQIVFLSNRKEMVSYWLLSDMKSRFTLKQEEEKIQFRESTEEEKKIICLTVTKEMMGNTLYINPDITLSSQDVEKIIYKGKTYILSK